MGRLEKRLMEPEVLELERMDWVGRQPVAVEQQFPIGSGQAGRVVGVDL